MNPPLPNAQPGPPPAPPPQGGIAALWAVLEARSRISDDMARDMRRRWLANAVMLGDASPNELRAMEGLQILPPGVSVRLPPNAKSVSAARNMVCLGCGAPIGGVVVCTYCLRRS